MLIQPILTCNGAELSEWARDLGNPQTQRTFQGSKTIRLRTNLRLPVHYVRQA